ncbi:MULTISPECIES: SRPBCC family protein [Streptomyces]|uniref:SRPBCC family protein n=1 Tax=Streptomyces TaxID=1883 RepID=UPI000A364D98|nr:MULTISPECIES: SRPBCC family protein [Streptomyces]MDI3098223.1 SRPBCC family protein [Streptomyces sp. AN-3]WDI22410.1 SRPBCC family protein [Streptomyces enissocaesilis]WQC16627.1 SRPBCC family protein [Streptomyces rochei]
MSPERQGDGGPSPLGDLKDALGGYLSATGHSLVGKAGERIGGLTERLTDSADGGGSRSNGGSGGSGGSVKATHIMESVDIGVPLRTVYDQWTQLQDFSGFTKGVQSVSPHDEVTSDWTAKIAFSTRSWKATVQEQIPDQRIVWTSEGAKGSTNGVVTFHELAPRLTRVVVVVEYYPAGFFEKTGNLWRAQGRRLRLDLKHFARHVTLRGEDEELEGWRGEIRDGEVVRSHEEALEEEHEDGEDEDEGDDGEYDDTRDDEYDAYDDQDEEDAYDEEEGEYDEEDGDDDSDDGDEDDDAYEDRPRARPRR